MGMIYYQCEKCLQIMPETERLIENNKPHCKYCNSKNKFVLWPSIEIRELFSILPKYSPESTEYSLIASVLISSAFELLLERLLFTMAIENMSWEAVGHLIDYLLESNQGRTKRLHLYRRLGYSSFEKESQETGNKNFYSNWNTIAETRNKLIHGNLRNRAELTQALVDSTISEGLQVFSTLHNKYNAFAIHYEIAIESKNNILKDSEKLKRWKAQCTNNTIIS